MVSLEFQSKFTIFWGNSWISIEADRAFTGGFPISSMGVCRIFSGIAQYNSSVYQISYFCLD